MSERMIQLQRARLLAAGKGNPAVAIAPNGAPLRMAGSLHPHRAAVSQTPQQAALAAVQHEDEQMQIFLQRLQEREDLTTSSSSSRHYSSGSALLSSSSLASPPQEHHSQQEQLQQQPGPTVPTALSRRILHQQGAGYLDETVAAITSAAADRFLATVLQQAVACRDQRLKGAEMAREAIRYRKRHFHQYQADCDDRQRRKQDHLQKYEAKQLATIEAVETAKKSATSSSKATAISPNKKASSANSVDGKSTKDTAATAKSKKKKKVETDSVTTDNGSKRKPTDKDSKSKDNSNDDDDALFEQDEASYDSIDEEENYYRSIYGDQVPDIDSDKEAEEEIDETLILRDLSRPLEAWGFHMTGKIGMFEAADLSEDDDDANNNNNNNDNNSDDDAHSKNNNNDTDMSDDDFDLDFAASTKPAEGKIGNDKSTAANDGGTAKPSSSGSTSKSIKTTKDSKTAKVAATSTTSNTTTPNSTR